MSQFLIILHIVLWKRQENYDGWWKPLRVKINFVEAATGCVFLQKLFLKIFAIFTEK